MIFTEPREPARVPPAFRCAVCKGKGIVLGYVSPGKYAEYRCGGCNGDGLGDVARDFLRGPCPICRGIEGCDHTVPERLNAAPKGMRPDPSSTVIEDQQ